LRRIVILNTAVNDTNLGNKIIMEAVYLWLRTVFRSDFIYEVPALEYLTVGRALVVNADYVFLGGTNLLSSNMRETSEWRVRYKDTLWLNDVILMGVGWWQYEDIPPTTCSRLLLSRVLTKRFIHSVRDSYTAKKLRSMGFKAVSTGCPTIWGLNSEHCSLIRTKRAENVLLTFTEYNQSPRYDKLLFDILRKNYSKIYFWPQMFGDYRYAKSICGNNIVFVDPSIEALDDLLKTQPIDYVGTRLHAGIRALQHKQRTIIVGIDNRAIEMRKDFNLPVIARGDIPNELEKWINSCWKTEIYIPEKEIGEWCRQFTV